MACGKMRAGCTRGILCKYASSCTLLRPEQREALCLEGIIRVPLIVDGKKLDKEIWLRYHTAGYELSQDEKCLELVLDTSRIGALLFSQRIKDANNKCPYLKN